MVRRGQRQRGAVIMSAGRALQIASGLDPGQPGETRSGEVPAAGAGVRSVPGAVEIDAVLQALPSLGRVGLAPRRTVRSSFRCQVSSARVPGDHQIMGSRSPG
jgi:hypothetical protein